MEKKPKKGAPSWMVSFCDLMQLLLTFFIMLFATSSTDAAKLEELVSYFARGNSIFDKNKSELVELNKKPLGDSDTTSIDKTQEYDKESQEFNDKKENFENTAIEYNSKDSQIIEYELNEKLSNLGYSNEEIKDLIEVSATSEGVLVTFKDGVLFTPGSAEVKESNKKLLTALGETFNKNTSIKIEGHTDNIPTGGSKYESNWELSTARAISVMRYLIDKKFINETNCSVSGFAEFKPVADNTTDENRALNRRVEILLINS